jgi:hypothetical protein
MQPVIIEDSISIAANTTVDNIIVSNASLRGLLQTPYNCRGKLLAVTSAAGLRVDFSHSSKLVVGAADLRTANQAEEPYDIINDEWYAEESEQLTLRVTNSTAGALTLRYRIVLTPWEEELPPDCLVMTRGPVAVAAAAVDQQLLDGLIFQRLPGPSLLRVLMTASATGLIRQLFVDQDRIAPPSAVTTSNRVPIDPIDNTIEGVEVEANALQQLMVSNPTGGSLNVFWKTKNQELVRR